MSPPAPSILVPLLLGWAAPVRAAEPDIVAVATEVIEERMPDGADSRELHAAAIRGMASWLDEQSGSEGNGLLTEAEFEERMARLRGERVGLGIDFTIAAGRGLLVAEVMEGSAAEKAGLGPGDLVVAIDDRPFTGVSAQGILGVVSELAQRPRDQRVVLDLRVEDGDLRRVELMPSLHRAPTVSVDDGEDRRVVRIDVIGPGTAHALAKAVDTLGSRPLLLDLRDLDECALDSLPEVAGVLLGPDVPLVRTVDPKGKAVTVMSTGKARVSARIAVLVNRGTSGLAEGLAHALRGRGAAVIVGTRSAGRATHPSYHPIGDGWVLQLADTALQADDGSTWAGEGIGPDLVVEPLQIPLVGASRIGLPDIQVEAAVRFVSGP